MSEHRLRDAAGTLRMSITGDRESPRVAIDDALQAIARLHHGPRLHHADTIAFDLDGHPVEALVIRQSDRVTVALNGQVYSFATGDAVDASAPGRLGTGQTLAPMPGKVIAVLVHEGEQVSVGQGLIVLEAMKMENTLAAEIDGQVQRVTVAAGDLVDGGALLVEIGP